ncbi:MAG: hypothetical protein ACFHU9_11795 [Fluviicola sp.]
MKYRSKKFIEQDPELRAGYKKLFRGIILYGNIPWVIMGFGIVTGLADSLVDFFNPKSMSFIVLAFHLSIIVLWVIGFWWIYFKKGAEFIEKHPGLFEVRGFGTKGYVTAKQVKIFYPLMIAGGIAGMVMMWNTDFPTPPF